MNREITVKHHEHTQKQLETSTKWKQKPQLHNKAITILLKAQTGSHASALTKHHT